jgi:mono/diheme cytochrome c family protein
MVMSSISAIVQMIGLTLQIRQMAHLQPMPDCYSHIARFADKLRYFANYSVVAEERLGRMKPFHKLLGVLACALLPVTAAGLVQAQDHAHPGAESTCDVNALLEHQQEHAAALATLAEDLEHDPQSALEALYVTGIAYQSLAIECGFSRTAEAEEAHNEEHGITAQADLSDVVIGDAVNGEVIFNTVQPENGFACATCHRSDSTERLVGPGLLGVGSLAHDPSAHAEGETGDMGGMEMDGMAMDGHDAHAATEEAMGGMVMGGDDGHAATEEAHTERTLEDVVTYIRTSILHPNDYIVPGFPENLMPQNYAEILTEAEVNDLIAYLLTLQ